MLTDYVTKIKGSKAMYFVQPKGLTGANSVSIKKLLFDENSDFNVVKNTVFIRAIKESGIAINSLEDVLSSGEHAIVFAKGDVASPMKVIKNFISENKDKLEVLAGILEGKWVSKSSVLEIADLPDRNTMLARTLGTFNGVTTNFVRASANNVERLLNVLNAISDSKK